jgi:DeoR/GlpR family transcriptional regulator of sugar metabolism
MLVPNTSASGAQLRQDEILRVLKTDGAASIAEMAERFEVSEMTVRRALSKLAGAGLIIRTPGGAMAAPSNSLEKNFLDRARHMAGAKDAIGRAASAQVKEGETVVLDSGTTTRYIARHLASRKGLAVVTTSLAVLEELTGSKGVSVQLTGGVYRRSSHDLFGASVIEALEGIQADKVFFGAAALSFHKGVMNYDAEMPRALLRAAKQRILVLDSSKIGIDAVYRFCPTTSCDLVITDEGIKPAHLARLVELTEVVVAK